MSHPRKQSEHTKGIIAIIGASFVFSALSVGAKALAADLGLFQQMYLRSLPAVLLCFLLGSRLFGVKRETGINLREWALAFLRSVIWNVLAVAPFIVALTLAPVANVAILSALPLSAAWTFVLFRERIAAAQIGLIVLSCFGLALIAIHDLSELLVWGKGEILASVSSLFFALSIVLRRFHSGALSDRALTEMFLVCGCLIAFAISLLWGEPQRIDGSLALYANLLFSGVLIWLSAFLCSYGIKRISGALAGNLFLLEFIFSGALGYIFFNEMPSARSFLGAAIIIASAVALNHLEAKNSPAQFE